MTNYISVEQEAVLNDCGLVEQARLDHWYVIISDVPWGHEPENWRPRLIGHFDQNKNAVLRMEFEALVCKNHGEKVVEYGKERGEWVQGFYKPHPDEV